MFSSSILASSFAHSAHFSISCYFLAWKRNRIPCMRISCRVHVWKPLPVSFMYNDSGRSRNHCFFTVIELHKLAVESSSIFDIRQAIFQTTLEELLQQDVVWNGFTHIHIHRRKNNLKILTSMFTCIDVLYARVPYCTLTHSYHSIINKNLCWLIQRIYALLAVLYIKQKPPISQIIWSKVPFLFAKEFYRTR